MAGAEGRRVVCYNEGENIGCLRWGRDVNVGSHCRATLGRLLAKSERVVEELAPQNLSTPQL